MSTGASNKRKLLETLSPEKEGPKKSKESWKSVTKAINYYEKGKFGKALPLLFRHEEVEARAMFLLACMYAKGEGVIENMKTAASYMVKLVQYDDIRREEEDLLAMAHFYLGDLYYKGVVFPKDDSKAEKHWRQGAILNKSPETGCSYFGTMKCQTMLGMFYSTPKLKKSRKAFYWHKRAAESGSIVSEGALGVMYMYGIGTDEDMQLAYNHLAKAAVMDNIYAQGYLAAFYYKRQIYHRTIYFSKELADIEDYELFAEMNDCNVEHVKQGVAIGCFYLAMCLQYGYAVEKNIYQAKKLIKKALEISTDVTYDLHIDAICGTV